MADVQLGLGHECMLLTPDSLFACAGVCYLAGVPVVDWLLSLVQLLYFVVTSLLWGFWQLLQPSQDKRHAGLPELHQVICESLCMLVSAFPTCWCVVGRRPQCRLVQCGGQEHSSPRLPGTQRCAAQSQPKKSSAAATHDTRSDLSLAAVSYRYDTCVIETVVMHPGSTSTRDTPWPPADDSD